MQLQDARVSVGSTKDANLRWELRRYNRLRNFEPCASPCLNCGGGDQWCRHLSILREFYRAKSYCHLMALKANDRRTSSPLPRRISWTSILLRQTDDIWLLLPRSNHWEVGGRPQCDKCGCRVRNCSQHRFNDFGDNFKIQEQLSGGSVVVVHEEPHLQMTGTLSYRPEETGGRQREKSLDTRHRRLDDRYRVLPWPEDCTVVVCLHDALYGVYL
ncbi:hypothetical protein TNCV_1013361 [Trichonephila clavipes]|uniref:Uncharacterized protein n=1 Tax=Trichonephila clavipes TaxID=2585209 RepID=A0A8X7BB56_TRICX|nr:hypothetical protein TNCV_1013361 [Trichonephila clavipes]